MKTFTVRDLDREPSRVLDACDSEGAVEIRRRDGRTYTLRPWTQSKTGEISLAEWLRERRKRTREIFKKPVSKKQMRAVDRMIAGR